MEIGKIPPQALDMEEAVLGAVMIQKEAIDTVYPILTPDHFYKEAYHVIYEVILELYRESEPIDILTVTEKLRSQDKLEQVGGPYVISGLTSKIASAANVEYHALIVKQKAIQRNLITYSCEVQQRAFDDTIDLEDLLNYSNSGLEKIMDSVYSQGVDYSFPYLLKQSIHQYEEREKAAKEGVLSGIKTPVLQLSKITGGWQDTDLIVIAGRPSMGKTAFALASIKEAAKLGRQINVYSLEMSSVRLVDRILTGEADIDPERFRNGYLNTEEWEALEKAFGRLEKLGIHIDDCATVTMDYIKARSRVKRRKGECDMIVIDYLQLVDNPEAKGKSREQEVSQMSRQAKKIAMELGVPVILLAQLNRSCELRGGSKKPELADLRESGAIEQDADLVCMLYRAERYNILEFEDGSPTKGIGEIIIAKQRNGRIGSVNFGYNDSLTRIFDADNTDCYTDRDKNPNADQFHVPTNTNDEFQDLGEPF